MKWAIWTIAWAAFSLIGFLSRNSAQITQTNPRFPQQYGSWGFDLMGRDMTVKPGDNFFCYADGGYLNQLVIPADRSGYSTATVLTEASETAVYSILQDTAKAHHSAPNGEYVLLRSVQSDGAHYRTPAATRF